MIRMLAVLSLITACTLARAQMTVDFSFVMNGPQAGTLSPGTGGEVLSGITYNTGTKVLTLNAVAFGSAFGPFIDLQGQFTHAHIHNQTTGILFDLDSMTTTDASKHSGLIAGQVTFTDQQQTALLSAQDYINVHSTTFPDGEIRGQLIPVPEPGLYGLMAALGIGGFAACRRLKLAGVLR